MIGIYDCFGYDVPFSERYKLIKESGFDCVMLWWSDKFGRGSGYREDVDLARNAGLTVENIHAPVHEQEYLSMDDQNGESVYQSYLQCVTDCDEYGIPTVVIHLPSDDNPINELGLKRIEAIVYQAEKCGVKIAFENLGNVQNLELVMKTFQSPNVGFCYDSCHHINYAPQYDLLEKYGNRLYTLHLHDNGGINNQHQLPFDGNIDWETVVKKISITGYKGATSLEPMNWDYEDISINEFLKRAFKKAKKLDDMRKHKF
ncbi:MAG: sugar phosphate isomerase/epimerase [Oscillospiraceae bacterium]|nr:sugar phosphate isomerase/epimerase [Oscillospiraceae bacterium]